MPRLRLDAWLVDHGHAESREKARALVMAGRVRVSGRSDPKPGMSVPGDAVIEVDPGPVYVGRGALKLEGAVEACGVDPTGRTAVDVGASTGGFTEVLLARGARRVYAVDVGRAQLHESLRRDDRVVVLERVNARHLTRAQVPEACSLATVDVSFISVLKVLPALRDVLTDDAELLVLVKPQFEAGRRDVGRGGVVRDPALHRRVLEETAAGCAALGLDVAFVCPSPVEGAEGNREFFLHLRRGAKRNTVSIGEMIAAALK